MDRSLIHVLLIEDHADTAELVRVLLARDRLGRFDVCWADHLGAGLAHAVPAESGVVLLDLWLPDSDGFDTFLAARRRWPAAPIVVLSSANDEEMALRAVREGAQDYIDKGRLDGDLLARAIRYAIGRRNGELALARERNLLRNLIDALPDHVYAKDLDGRFVVVNRATRRFFGADADADLIGRTDADLFPPDAAAAFRAEEAELARSGDTLVDREAAVVPRGRYQDGNGESGEVWVRTQKAPLRDAGGQVIGIVGVNRVITERRRARAQLEQANAALAAQRRELLAAVADLERSHRDLQSAQLQLVQAEKMDLIGRLAAGVAHEVKNPLAVVLAGIDYLSRRPGAGDDGAEARALATMADAVRRADAVVRGLLDFAAPETLTLGPARLDHVVHQALRLAKHELARAGVTAHTELPPDLPPVRLDDRKVEQVLVILLINAAQAIAGGGTPAGGGSLTVRVRGERQSDPPDNGHPRRPTAIVEVDDTGPGIQDDHRGRLFDPFFTTKPPGQGTGLGLTVAKTIMELHGGTLSLQNRPGGGGARATLIFPAEGD